MSTTLARCAAWGVNRDIPLLQALKEAPSVEVFLGLLDFEVDYDGHGNIDELGWTGKYWQSYTHACLEAIAAYVEEGSFLEAALGEGEEFGELDWYLWAFTDGKLTEQQGRYIGG